MANLTLRLGCKLFDTLRTPKWGLELIRRDIFQKGPLPFSLVKSMNVDDLSGMFRQDWPNDGEQIFKNPWG